MIDAFFLLLAAANPHAVQPAAGAADTTDTLAKDATCFITLSQGRNAPEPQSQLDEQATVLAAIFYAGRLSTYNADAAADAVVKAGVAGQRSDPSTNAANFSRCSDAVETMLDAASAKMAERTMGRAPQ